MKRSNPVDLARPADLRLTPISRVAAGLMLPSLAWVSFAAVLNGGFWWLNR